MTDAGNNDDAGVERDGSQNSDRPYEHTAATRLFADGLRNLAEREETSARQLAERFGYKTSVVLSHMATGRVPIPLEKVPQFAALLNLDGPEFAGAVLQQRYPDIWVLLGQSRRASAPHASALAIDLETIAGRPLDALSPDQKAAMREVAADLNASKRWLTVHEFPVIDMLREYRPDMRAYGLSSRERFALEQALTPVGAVYLDRG